MATDVLLRIQGSLSNDKLTEFFAMFDEFSRRFKAFNVTLSSSISTDSKDSTPPPTNEVPCDCHLSISELAILFCVDKGTMSRWCKKEDFQDVPRPPGDDQRDRRISFPDFKFLKTKHPLANKKSPCEDAPETSIAIVSSSTSIISNTTPVSARRPLPSPKCECGLPFILHARQCSNKNCTGTEPIYDRR